MTGDDILNALADLLADRVAARLTAQMPAHAPSSAPTLATSTRNPLGSSSAFLRAARAGRFPSRMRGREVVADWSDVEAYDRARQRPRRPACATMGEQSADAQREAALRRAGALDS